MHEVSPPATPSQPSSEPEREHTDGPPTKRRVQSHPRDDIDAANRGLKENYQFIAPLKGKDTALFVGNTGAGKSTTVNFLRGCKMERTTTFGRTTYDCKDPQTPNRTWIWGILYAVPPRLR